MSPKKPKKLTAEQLLATHDERVWDARMRQWSDGNLPPVKWPYVEEPMPTSLEYLTAWRRL